MGSSGIGEVGSIEVCIIHFGSHATEPPVIVMDGVSFKIYYGS